MANNKMSTTHPDVMKLRNLNYGNRFLVTDTKPSVGKCKHCLEDVYSDGYKIFGELYHGHCYIRSRLESNQ